MDRQQAKELRARLEEEAKNLQAIAPQYGLSPDTIVGAEFVSLRGETFRLKGYNPRAHKYPVLAISYNKGVTYKFPEEILRQVQGSSLPT